MKKAFALVVALVLCLTFFADGADARRGGGFRSTPRPTRIAPKPATPKPTPKRYNVNRNNQIKLDQAKKARKQKGFKPLNGQKGFTEAPKGQSRSYYDNRFSGRSYYRGGGFASQLLTAAGVYLLLDHFTGGGDPVYVNAETGEEMSKEELDQIKAQPVDDNGNTETAAASEQQSEKKEEPSLTPFLIGGAALLGLGFLFGRRRRA